MDIFTPTLFKAVGRYAASLRTRHERVRTERLLNDLPASIRKDIGWPDSFPERRAHRAG
jgi:hypothetical protein